MVVKHKKTIKKVLALSLVFTTVFTSVTPSNVSIFADEGSTSEEVVVVEEDSKEESSKDSVTTDVSSENVTKEEVATESPVETSTEEVTEFVSEDTSTVVEVSTEGSSEEVVTPDSEVVSEDLKDEKGTKQEKKENSDEDKEVEKGKFLIKSSEGGEIKVSIESKDGELVDTFENKEGNLSSKNGVIAVKKQDNGFYLISEQEVDSSIVVEVTSKSDYKIESYSKKVDSGAWSKVTDFGKEIPQSYKTTLKYVKGDTFLDVSFVELTDEEKSLVGTITEEGKEEVTEETNTSEVTTEEEPYDDGIDLNYFIKRDSKGTEDDALLLDILSQPDDAVFNDWDDSWNFKKGKTTWVSYAKNEVKKAKADKKYKSSKVAEMYQAAIAAGEKEYNNTHPYQTITGVGSGKLETGSNVTITIDEKASSFAGWKITGASCCTHTAAAVPSGTKYNVYVDVSCSKPAKSNTVTFSLKVWALPASYCNSSKPDSAGHLKGFQSFRGKKSFPSDVPDEKRVNVRAYKLLDPRYIGYYDMTGASPVQGAVFTFSALPDKGKEEVIGTRTTDGSGWTGSVSYKLEKDTTFYAQETTAPPGFYYNGEKTGALVKFAEADDDDDVDLFWQEKVDGSKGLTNTPVHSPLTISVHKVEGVSGKSSPIPGVKFKITWTNGYATSSAEMTTDAYGNAEMNVGTALGFPDGEVLQGKLYLEETYVPEIFPNVHRDTTVYSGTLTCDDSTKTISFSGFSGTGTNGCQLSASGDMVHYTEVDEVDRGYCSIQKYGSDTQKAEHLDGYSFEGIEYGVYAAETINEVGSLVYNKDQDTGYRVTCNAQGYAAWKDTSKDKILPIGKYYFKETKGNAYYPNDDPNKYEFTISTSNLVPATVQATGANSTNGRIGNTPARVDINFTKYRSWRDAKYIKPMENIPFLITWTHDGVTEQHIAVTNAEGKFDSSAFNSDATVNVNDALIGKGLTQDSIIKTSELDNTHGIYFGTVNGVNVGRVNGAGAIPVGVTSTGTLNIRELWCETNASFETLYETTIEIGPGKAIPSGAYTNYKVPGSDWEQITDDPTIRESIRNNPLVPEIVSTALGKTTGTHQLEYNNDDSEATIEDTVTSSKLTIGHKYELQGKVLIADSKEAVVGANGDLTASEQFTATQTIQNSTMSYTFDMSKYQGKNLVVLVKLYDLTEAKEWGTEPYGDDFMMAEESDVNNASQTVYVPRIETDAYDFISNDHQVMPTIIDLADARKVNNSVDANKSMGSDETSKSDDTKAEDSKSKTDSSKTDDSKSEDSSDSTKKVEAESSGIESDDKKTGESDTKDDSDKSATTKITASDLFIDESAWDYKDITFSIHDDVSLFNFLPGNVIYFKGIITDSKGNVVATAGDDFELSHMVTNQEQDKYTVDFENVTIKNFNLNTGDNLYVSEEVYYKNAAGNYVLLAKHDDPEDERQKIYITGLWSEFNGSSVVTGANHQSAVTEAGSTTTLSDTLILHNLIAGYSYKLTNEARFTDTGEVVVVNGKTLSETREITASADMVSDSNGTSGHREVFSYTVDTSVLKGRSITFGEYVSYNDVEINVHNRTNDAREQTRFPNVKTQAKDSKTLISIASIDDTVLNDTVELENLQADTSFIVKGVLMDKATNEYLGKDLGLKPITATSKEFTTKGDDSERFGKTVELSFSIPDATKFEGKDVVVFEELYVGDTLVGYHKDINDLGQTVTFVKERTTASWETGLKLANAEDREFTLNDVVHYTGLIVGKEYEQKAKLWQNDGTGKAVPFLVNGVQPEASVTFKPEKSEGDVTLSFKINTKDLQGNAIVVFEDLYYKGIRVATHSDINDKDQTVYVPGEKTTANWDNGTKLVNAEDKEFTLNDVVHYEGLIPGKEYEQKAALVQDDGSGNAVPFTVNGQQVTSTVKFVPETPSGDVTVSFVINTADLAGETIVVFEDLYSEGVKIATHSDITDKEQTVYIPEIGTTATGKDGKKKVDLGKKVTIKDTVAYSNLLIGDSYVVKGIVVTDGKKGKVKEVSKWVEKTFVADESGKVEVKFTVDTTDFAGKDLVVFEEVYDAAGNLVAEHKDIDDEGQSVTVKKIPKSEIPRTSDNLLWFLLMGIILVITGVGLVYKSKRTVKIK